MPLAASTFLAADLTLWLMNHAVETIGLIIVIGGLGLYGVRDVLRFSLKRIWAISGVCFDESIRRRVLWIIPLAILGLVVVVQLQQPVDEQDAIRQTTKFCLFDTGLVVVISTIILACTNLPREIENRVIFTVVTKPTTRLEIVLGKIFGFARVSATILLIMGGFTFGYLHFRAWSLERDLKDRLRTNAVEAVSRPTFQHYIDAGLLNARTFSTPVSMSLFGQTPIPGSRRRYPTPEGTVMVPFELPRDMWAVADPEGKEHPGPGMTIKLRVGYDPVKHAATPANPNPVPSPMMLTANVYDPNGNNILSNNIQGIPAVIPSTDGTGVISLDIAPSYVALLAKYPVVFIGFGAGGGEGNLWVNDDAANPPAELVVPVTSSQDPAVLRPLGSSDPFREVPMVFTNRDGVSGKQLKGDPNGASQVGIFHFRGMKVEAGDNQQIPVELRVGVEKSGDIGDEDVPTTGSMTVLNLKTNQESASIKIEPENERPFYASVPAASVEGGNFDVRVRLLSPGQWLNVKPRSLSIVQAENSFAMNLLKSMFILWLLSILVITIAVFCSTFLSWPIAVMLTLVILLGRWGVNELGDAATAGLGRQFVQDFGVRDVAISTAVSSTVEELNKMLKTVATALPDIEQFAVTDDIESGISIPLHTLTDSGLVLLYFGVPLTVLAYIFLKNKEVAP